MRAAKTVSVALMFLTVAGGCASSASSRRQAGIGIERRPQALFAPFAASSPDEDWQAPEYSRRDYQMNVASAALPTALDQWPTPPQPSLAHRGSVFLSTRQFGDTVIFFYPEGSRRHGPHGHGPHEHGPHY